ncbi:1-aminocyclopropane-1-carboxylate deaminase [Pseudomonas syringae]|uniref:1-aminocyclopropane-1-carboxylate deaminase n=1 Tax=Pseudomonas syringae TaxID=317 RepID=A0A1C7Z606_PSESX|nr:1-aminocyclopropane-1-carboxylate deaminase [Pseudomonas syringae]OCR24809.1 1-aminocyclopropane-1-carboxylate deaminase [Pseudomonas syringae]
MSLNPINWQPHAPLQPLKLPWLDHACVEVAVLRLDLIDALISGNKWFKLDHHLAAASEANAQGVISLGGAHSNHLHALAAAGKRFDFPTVGLLRGHAQETPTTRDLQAFGMQLHWLGYGGYRARHEPDFWLPWLARYPDFYPIPEGGGGLAGASGCAELLSMARGQLGNLSWDDYHGWWLAAGTGTTLAGLVLAEAGAHPVYGAMAVPDGHGVQENVAAVLHAGTAQACRSELEWERACSRSRLTLSPDNKLSPAADSLFHLLDASRGGFAKTDPLLLDFIAASENQSGIPFEPLYTGKALLMLRDEVSAGRFVASTRLIFIHTGGLQGRRAMGL